MDKQYQWDSPADWLLEKVRGTDNVSFLRGVIEELVYGVGLNNDDIQDSFQSEMEVDGYFEEVDND